MKKQYGCIVPVSMLSLVLILGLLLFPQLAQAQSNRNPCIYLTTSNQNCIPVGSSVTGVGNSPMPVGGLATAAAPTYVEGMPGSLSFDLSGALRTTAAGGGGGSVTQGTTPWIVAGQGTAGSAATGILTVQGIAAMTPLLVTLQAGSAIAGKFGIDQTTPGTTNLVALSAETTKVIGTVNQGTSPWVISGSLTANQSVNVAQINGVTPLMGNGATGTGSPRVTISSDNTAVAGLGVGATAAAPVANAVQNGAVTGSATTGGKLQNIIQCDNHVFKHITTATDTLAVQGVTSQIIYICAWRSRAAGDATWYLENTASTNANCSSSNTQLTGVATETANSGEVFAPPFWTGLKNTVSNGLCINSTGTGGVDIDIWYTQF